MRARARHLVLVLVALLATTGCGSTDGGYDLSVSFSRAVALYEGSAVRVMGVDVGTITAIEIVDDGLRVSLSIDEDVPLPADVQASIVPQSVTYRRGALTANPVPECAETIVNTPLRTSAQGWSNVPARPSPISPTPSVAAVVSAMARSSRLSKPVRHRPRHST